MSEIRSQATPARDELAGVIHAEICEESLEDCLDPDWRGKCSRAADVLLPAGWSKPRTVNSMADLDALPVESVIAIDGCPKAYFKQSSTLCWAPVGRTTPAYLTSRGLLGGDLPSRTARVLFAPGDAG